MISHVCGRDKTVDSSTCGPSGEKGFMSRGFDHHYNWALQSPHPNVRDIRLSWAVGNVTRPIGPPFFVAYTILHLILFASIPSLFLFSYQLLFFFFSTYEWRRVFSTDFITNFRIILSIRHSITKPHKSEESRQTNNTRTYTHDTRGLYCTTYTHCIYTTH